MSIDYPFVAVFISTCLNQGWVRARYFRFGHGETGGSPPFAKRLEVLLQLFFRSPVQQGMHIAFVWSLTV